MMDIDAILKDLVARHGSDLHLKVGRPPLMRISSQLLPSEFPVVDDAEIKQMLHKILGDEGMQRLANDFECDTAYSIEDVARFRVNAFRRMGHSGAVLRVIPLAPPTIDAMGLPPVLKDICQAGQGMVLVTGPTGSGKSTTLAAMIEYLNESEPLHIITIEDPIEFVYTDRKCTINQRQLGNDVKSLHEALRRALRQDPDVILMGEMRDVETVELAMHAAETGHLVFSTLHTNDAKQTLDRIVDMFPSTGHHQIRAMLALTLQAVVSQRLVRRADGNGRVAAVEILINSPNIRELVAEGKTASIEKAMMQSGEYYRMQTFNQALSKLTLDGVIAEAEALSTSSNPNDLKLLLKGIQTGAAATASAIAAKGSEGQPSTAQPGKMKITKGF